ncbi:MAG: excinuclease ABC subunit UvrB [Dysgonamonadaceae bacterium]|nr:excinuclease ABC subunit UvrB [Dysgonamonadaceae bacterium]
MYMDFKLTSDYQPTGDQPEAISALVSGLNQHVQYQTLLGVTGSGKTFTVANVIQEINCPTLVLSHNKTLAAQLYEEFKNFFPDNAVEYFVSYYDYYQPEAYLPSSNTYIEKDLSINAEIEKLRLSATSALLSGRKDVIIVSSVSCLYGIGNPDDFEENKVSIYKGQKIARDTFLRKLVDSLYSRDEREFNRGNFRVKGDTVDVFLAYADFALRVSFWGDEIENIYSFDPITGGRLNIFEDYNIFPANLFVTTRERINRAVAEIQIDLGKQIDFFKSQGKMLEAKRIEDRVTFDLEMIKELGYCSGIENYSRYFDGRDAGTRPFCLMDYFPKDYLLVVDESHVTIPQIRGMFGGDNSRKRNLVEYGFRLPAAIDNRPLNFEEFEAISGQTIYVSATPADYELYKSEGVVIEQLIRPTGLLDPVIEIRPSLNQIDDLMEEISQRIKVQERVLVTTLTKRMAEELNDYLSRMGVNCSYIHSDVETLERIEIMENLRHGVFDVLIGVNLLREGLDLPEVSLVAILDADKEGFLRSHRSLMQTAGRAARHINGKVIFYADKITDSMQKTIDETNHHREKQIAYNKEHGITPQQIKKGYTTSSLTKGTYQAKAYMEPETISLVADPVVKYMSKPEITKLIEKTRKAMQLAAKNLNFLEAAQYRDELIKLEKMIN